MSAYKKLYTVLDTVSNLILGTVILEQADAPAIRTFHDALSNNQSALATHPADYNLICLGTIYMSTGEIQAHPPETVATGAQWAAAQNKDA